MKVLVTWWKLTGKWYTEELVDVGDASPYDRASVPQAVIERQTQMQPGEWRGYYITVVNDPAEPADSRDPFFHRLYAPGQFWAAAHSEAAMRFPGPVPG